RDIEERGLFLRGNGEVFFQWEGRELNKLTPLPDQGVRPNDIIRVGIKTPPLQLRRDNSIYDVRGREELREGDDIIIGRTYLRFHTRQKQKTLNKSATFFQRVRQGRSFQQTVYFMGLVGGFAGLCCWFLLSLLSLVTTIDGRYLDIFIFASLGGFIGGLSVGFNAQWMGDRVVSRWVMMGILAGSIAGCLGGALSPLIKTAVPEHLPLLTRMVGWLSAGAIIGFSVSLRWFPMNKSRALHGLLGGMFGGMLGGVIYWVLADMAWKGFSQALGFMLTGAGITCGISLAPILLRQAVLEFLNSRDQAVLKRYAQSHKQWEIHAGGRYLIGSLTAARTHTLFGPEVQIFIPDQLVAPRHAILIVRENKYYIEPHPELIPPCYVNIRAQVGGSR